MSAVSSFRPEPLGGRSAITKMQSPLPARANQPGPSNTDAAAGSPHNVELYTSAEIVQGDGSTPQAGLTTVDPQSLAGRSISTDIYARLIGKVMEPTFAMATMSPLGGAIGAMMTSLPPELKINKDSGVFSLTKPQIGGTSTVYSLPDGTDVNRLSGNHRMVVGGFLPTPAFDTFKATRAEDVSGPDGQPNLKHTSLPVSYDQIRGTATFTNPDGSLTELNLSDLSLGSHPQLR